MLKDLDVMKFCSVRDISKDILRNTVGIVNLPIDVEVIARNYNLFTDDLEEISQLSGETKEHKLFELSMEIIKHEYSTQHNEEIEKVYVSMGARYLMMPEKGFRENILSSNYNLLDLRKQIYTNVPIEDLAYHFADILQCVVCRWSAGSYVKTFVNHDMDNMSLRIYTDMVVRTLQRNSKAMHEEEFGECLKITGWRMDTNNIMLICLQNDSVYIQR
jgi:hypothetical protein